METPAGLGASTVFGLPGRHALGLCDVPRRSDLRYVGLRVENNAGFAADAYGRVTGEAAPLLLSAGPGALTSLPALQEAAAASAPVPASSSQVPTAGPGGGRHGHGDDTGRQGRFPPDARAVAPVLDGGPPHDGLPGGRRRPSRRRLGAGR